MNQNKNKTEANKKQTKQKKNRKKKQTTTQSHRSLLLFLHKVSNTVHVTVKQMDRTLHNDSK